MLLNIEMNRKSHKDALLQETLFMLHVETQKVEMTN